MRILFLTSRIPYPPNRGDKLRVYNFIKKLSVNHEIFLVSFIATKDEYDLIPALKVFCKVVKLVLLRPSESFISVTRNFYKPLPLQVRYYQSNRMDSELSRLGQDYEFDIVYAHLIRMAPYAKLFPSSYKVVDLTDLISEEIKLSLPFRNWISKVVYKIEIRRIADFESKIVYQFQEVWLISANESKILAAKNPGANIFSVVNGVDFDTFYPYGLNRKRNRVVFVGHMGVYHNIDAAKYFCCEILPGVRALIPDIEVLIVGADPTERVKRLADLPGVQVVGFVDNLAGLLNEAGLFVAPLRFSAGIQNKILEAMATGTPVITSKLANQGIGAEHRKNILLSEGTNEYISLITEMIGDPGKCDEIGNASAKFINENFSWNHVSERVHSIQEFISRKNP